MRKYWIYGAISILIIIAFIIGYFILENFISNQLMNQQARNQELENKNINIMNNPNIQLRPGELDRRLDGTITSVNISPDPAVPSTITITPLFDYIRFSIAPQDITDRKIELMPDVLVFQRAAFTTEEENITKQDLKVGDQVIITTIESVLDIATLDKYTAVMIRRIIVGTRDRVVDLNPKIQLRPGGLERRLDGTITSVNISPDPAVPSTITITPLFTPMRFNIIPQGITDRKIELRSDVLMLQGAPLAAETEYITKQDLKVGDQVIITTIESVLDIATLDKYTALIIRRVMSE